MTTPLDISEQRSRSIVRQPNPESQLAISLPLPKIWLGYAFAAIYWLVRILSAESQTGGMSPFLMVIAVSSWGYWLFCIYRIHKVLAKVTNGAYPVSPGKALGLMFVPFFNVFYWNFRWTRQIALFVNGRSPKVKVARYWPGVVLLLAWFLSVYRRGAGMILVFSVGLYLTHKIARVVRCTESAHTCSKTEPLSLSLSAGLSAAFAFILAQAVRGFPHQEHKGQEALAIVIVSVGLMWFIEPICDRGRRWFGMAEDHPPLQLKRPVLCKAAIFFFLMITSMAHTLLHEHVLHELNTTGLVLLMGLLASGGITYSWVMGAQSTPRRSAKLGLIRGALVGMFILSPVGLPVVNAMLGNHPVSKSVAFGSPIPGVGWETRPVAPAASPSASPGASLPQPLNPLLIALACPLFGFAGGLALDRTRNGALKRNLAAGLAISAALVFLLGRWQLQPHTDLQCVADIVFFVVGWWVGLFLYPSVGAMLAGPKPRPTPTVTAAGLAA